MPRPVITLLTDFGLRDHYVAAMKGVILGICPEAALVDVTHDVEPYQIVDAAHELAQCWRYFPEGTVHVVVVDPGVGSERRPVLGSQDGHHFVGPDNGVLTLAAANADWRHITETRFFRHPISSTFHGRDIFGPVAAHLLNGVTPQELGPLVSDPVRLQISAPFQSAPNVWQGEVIRIDRFGNAVTNFSSAEFSWIRDGSFRLETGARPVDCFCSTFAACPAGLPALVPGSSGSLEIVVNKQDASEVLGLRRHSSVQLARL